MMGMFVNFLGNGVAMRFVRVELVPTGVNQQITTPKVNMVRNWAIERDAQRQSFTHRLIPESPQGNAGGSTRTYRPRTQ